MAKKKKCNKKCNRTCSREKAYGEPSKVIPLEEYVEKYNVSNKDPKNNLWSKLLKILGLSK